MSEHFFNTDDFPVQEKFIEDALSGKYRVIIYGGAIKGGKTAGSLMGTQLYLHKWPGARAVIVRKTSRILEINTLPAWDKVKLDELIRFDNRSRVEFKNKSHIDFFGENIERDPELNRWKGLDVNLILLEEFNELDEATFDKSLERAGTWLIPGAKKQQPPPLIICTCNPAQNWVKRRVYNLWKEDRLPKDWLYIPARVTDNPYYRNNKEFMENLESLPPYAYQVFVLGNWDVAVKEGGEFYKYFELDDTIDQAAVYDPELALHISADFNVNPSMNATVWQIARPEDGDPVGPEGKTPEGWEIRLIDEIVLEPPRNGSRELGKEILTRYRNHKNGLFIYGDPAGLARDTRTDRGVNDFSIIEREVKKLNPERRVDRSAPSVVARGSWINDIFRIQDQGLRILINPDCHNSITDLVKVKEAPDGTKHKETKLDPKTKIRYEPFGHLSDSLDYFLCKAFKENFRIHNQGQQDLGVATGGYKVPNSARTGKVAPGRGRR